VGIVRLDRFRLNDNGRIATLEVLTLICDGASDVAGRQTKTRKQNHKTYNGTHYQQLTTLFSHRTLYLWTKIDCKGTTFF
jgi:hypothetical protein